MTNLIDILTHDQRELEGLLGELTVARNLRERRRILDDVTIELVWHAVVEETHLYPAVRRHLPDGAQVADKCASDNAQVERLLEELRRSTTADRAFASLTRRLADEVHEHLREEQHALLPRLAEHASPEDLRRLGERVESAFNRAPSRSQLTTPAHPRDEGDLTHRVREHFPPEPARETRPRRPRTPKDPDACDQNSMWPDLWATHRQT
ncbi:hemerythrin domain-containing protein [Actinoallomurus sp. NBC_01490]|uniref:hemerythrin domain-containing protein n=1 Tax=Actinoallomurus sp. NBC_01490 TaxID=2903557 RepID=UPI002E330CC6|nr:hemerythrin domain-containing protein [Actinoallomurus sp. NBC_01490]